jgi:hypothetical protein
LLVSAILALLTVAPYNFLASQPLALSSCSTAAEIHIITKMFLLLILFPVNIVTTLFIFGIVAVLLIFFSWIISFIFKVIIFYSFARFTRKNLEQKDVFLLYHLPGSSTANRGLRTTAQ